MPFDTQRRIPSPTGASLNLYTRLTRKRPRAVVQINHGLSEHAGRYARFADFLASHGFHSYAHDHRGHGLTTAPDARPGCFGTPEGDSKVLDDVAAVHLLIRKEHPRLPVVIFGHSMGGLVAVNHLLRDPAHIGAAAIWNANFTSGLQARAAGAILAWEKFRLGSDVPSRILARLTFQAWGKSVAGRATPFDWLSRDPVEVRKYMNDPLCGTEATISLWQDIFGFMLFAAKNSNFSRVPRDLPIHLVGGSADPATFEGKAVERFAERLRRMDFSNLFSRIYDQTRHESLNELNRDVIMTQFAAWLDEVIPV